MRRLIKEIARALGFHIHEWNKWNSIGELARQDGSIAALVQIRECETCGLKQTIRHRY